MHPGYPQIWYPKSPGPKPSSYHPQIFMEATDPSQPDQGTQVDPVLG